MSLLLAPPENERLVTPCILANLRRFPLTGTNDFSTPLNPGERWKTREALHPDCETTCVRFLHALHAAHL